MFTIGTDSEHGLFVGDKLVSAIGRIPGDKNNPYPLLNGGGLQVDNVLLEWNSPIAHTAKEFDNNIDNTLLDIYNVTNGQYNLGYDSTYIFPEEELQDEMAWIAGCTPDYNAYLFTGEDTPMKYMQNRKPAFKKSFNPLMRSAAAHIHISPFDNKTDAINLIKLMDLHLGIPSLFIDMDRTRRMLYGKAGSFRLKKYPNGARGIEYRVLGSFWVQNSIYRDWVFNTTKELYNSVKDFNVNREDSITAMTYINNYNVTDATSLIKKYGVRMP